MKDAEESDKSKFLDLLWMPPPGEEGQGVWSREGQLESVQKLKAAYGKKE